MLNLSHAIIEGYLEGPLCSTRPTTMNILTLKLNAVIPLHDSWHRFQHHRSCADKPPIDSLHVVTTRGEIDKITARRKSLLRWPKSKHQGKPEVCGIAITPYQQQVYLTWQIPIHVRRCCRKLLDHYWKKRKEKKKTSLKMCGLKKPAVGVALMLSPAGSLQIPAS